MALKILVVGRRGQVARKLVEFGSLNGIVIEAKGRPDCDIVNLGALAKTIDELEPSIVINAAAFTSVDLAEVEKELARAVNQVGPAILARICRRRQIPLIHISTDYVFDGTKSAPYAEGDRANPINYYGATKHAGEQEVLAISDTALVLRTSRVFSEFGENFLSRVMERAYSGHKLAVVADQLGCPTYAGDLAKALVTIADHVNEGWDVSCNRIFHAAGASSCSWYEFADRALQCLPREPGHSVNKIRPTSTSEWNAAARRPLDSRLACARIKDVFGFEIPGWEVAIDAVALKVYRRFHPNKPDGGE